jgi:hypothetical protein
MKIYFTGVGNADHINVVLEHPACPRVGDEVQFGRDDEDDEWSVRTVVHCPFDDDYDVYVVVGPPNRT